MKPVPVVPPRSKLDLLVLLFKSLIKSKIFWKLVATLLVSTGLLTTTDLVSLNEVLKVVTEAL